MPGLADIADELLPALFRRRRPLSIRQPIIGNDLPEQGGFSGNMLAPSQEPAPPVTVPTGMQPSQVALPDETRPRRITPNVLSSSGPTDNVALPPTPNEVDSTTRAARRVETDERGRPKRNITLQGDEQTLDYANRVAGYEPQKGGGGWWPAIRTAIAGFAAGGPVGAASAFGVRKLREHFEPTFADEEWKRQQLGQVAPAVQEIRAARKERLGEASTMANIDLAKARTDELRNRKDKEKWVIKQDESGVYRPVNQATGLDPDGKPVKGRLASSSEWELKVDNSGRYVPVNKRTGLDQSGKVVTARPLSGKAEEDVTFHNAQINQAISEAQAEQAKIDEGLKGIPRTIQSTDILGNPRTIANPDYTYNMTRRRELDDQIRRWKTQLKSKHGTSAQAEDPDIRAYADQYFNGDYAAAEAAAKP